MTLISYFGQLTAVARASQMLQVCACCCEASKGSRGWADVMCAWCMAATACLELSWCPPGYLLSWRGAECSCCQAVTVQLTPICESMSGRCSADISLSSLNSSRLLVLMVLHCSTQPRPASSLIGFVKGGCILHSCACMPFSK